MGWSSTRATRNCEPSRSPTWVVDGYGLLGEVDRGLALLGELIDRPAFELTVAILQLEPLFDPYRADPRFDELVERRERFEADAAEWAEENGPWLP